MRTLACDDHLPAPDLGKTREDLVDLTWMHEHAAHLYRVADAADDTHDPLAAPTAPARLVREQREVPGAEAHDRVGALVHRGDDLADDARRQRLTCSRVDDLDDRVRGHV